MNIVKYLFDKKYRETYVQRIIKDCDNIVVEYDKSYKSTNNGEATHSSYAINKPV